MIKGENFKERIAQILAFFSSILAIIAIMLFAMDYRIATLVLCILAIVLGGGAILLGEKMSKTGTIIGLAGIGAYSFVYLF